MASCGPSVTATCATPFSVISVWSNVPDYQGFGEEVAKKSEMQPFLMDNEPSFLPLGCFSLLMVQNELVIRFWKRSEEDL